jgi:hypothetical protein
VSEQYFTSSQFFAHFLRQVSVRPQAAQGFDGRKRLLPLKELSRVMQGCSRARCWLGREQRGTQSAASRTYSCQS